MSTGELSAEAAAYFEEKHINSLLEELFHDVVLHLPDDPLQFLLHALDRKTTLRLLLLGPSSCGKRTQSRRIAQKYGVVIINADDVFREEISRKTESGEKLASCMQEGLPMPSDIASELIIRRLQEEDSRSRGWVLNGFPRTRSEALRLQAAGISPILFILLDVSSEVAVRRCDGRRYDPLTQNVYHMEFAPPPREMAVERMFEDDGSLAAVTSQWKYFDARKEELIGCYEPVFVRIDGDRPVDVVSQEIFEQVESRYVAV
ncbi:adenylate kinase [Trypanosoma rangeli]|uniref:Adenylate kinase n=1 Tax=Trypanosoma rangeli TaxID=5698 RepID=A0A3R7KVX5_TRYRA|nr:adenylate kinase [Trypanosoma rangeli]RNF02428.1 adenylate kinase [Trypanosoma rangeli]|eukprot:RNF02428.1 adenylate kinase [Trypanosoma rangeli]